MRRQLFDEKFKRRDKLQVLADIIKVARNKSKTNTILRLANLQYNKFLECKEMLCNAGYLKEIDLSTAYACGDSRKKCLYKATDLGRKWSENVEIVYDNLEP